jgi:hypothetical protein
MYVGHFAIGLALKARYPKIPAIPIMMGVGFLDLLDGIFIMLGLNTVTPNLNSGPYLFFDLTFIDWDHSLVAALFWSAVWGLLFLKNRPVAVIAGLAAFSHFIADWPMHNADLALYPFSTEHYGYGLWGKLGNISWLLEGLFSAVLMGYAWTLSARKGISLKWPALVLLLLFLQLSPIASPMKIAAQLQEPYAHLIHGFLVSVGFVIPGFLLSWLIRREEESASKP